MTEPASEMDPGPDGRIPGTNAILLDLSPQQPTLDPMMNFGGTVPASGSLIK